MATEQRPTGPDGDSKHHPVREGRAIGPHGVGDPAPPGTNAHEAAHHPPGPRFPENCPGAEQASVVITAANVAARPDAQTIFEGFYVVFN